MTRREWQARLLTMHGAELLTHGALRVIRDCGPRPNYFVLRSGRLIATVGLIKASIALACERK